VLGVWCSVWHFTEDDVTANTETLTTEGISNGTSDLSYVSETKFESAVQAYPAQKHDRGRVIKPSGQQFTSLTIQMSRRARMLKYLRDLGFDEGLGRGP
jgi:hypothetical protein